MSVKYASVQMNSIMNAIQSNDGFFAKFKSAGSADMAGINGAITPVNFTLEDLPTVDFLLEKVSFLLVSESVMELSDFGNIAPLVNGMLFQANPSNPIVAAAASIQTNADVMLISSNVVVQDIKIKGVTKSVLYGTWDFTDTFSGNAPLIFNNDLIITVQDDLSGMDFFQMSCHGVTIIDNTGL